MLTTTIGSSDDCGSDVAIQPDGKIVVVGVSDNGTTDSEFALVRYGTTLASSADLTIAVTDVNEAPTGIALSSRTVAENQPVGAVVGVVSGTDPDAGQSATLAFSLVSGFGDNSQFSLDPGTSQLKAAASFDFETNRSYSVKIRATDCGSPALSYEQEFTISVTDVNEAPSVHLINTTTALAENTGTGSRIKVADIVVTDDALGTNDLSLRGADASMFEIDRGMLYLKAGSVLDHETNFRLDVVVLVDDPTVGSSPDATVLLSIDITDVNEAPTDIGLVSAGSSGLQYNWQRIAVPPNIAEPGMAVYQGDLYLIGGRLAMTHYAPCSDEIWRYDPATSSWEQMDGHLPYGMYTRNYVTVAGDNLVVSPGEGPSLDWGAGHHQKIVQYDFIQDQASEVQTGSYPNVTWGVAFGDYDPALNRIYSFGGWGNEGRSNQVYSYQINSGTLQLVPTAVLSGRHSVSYVGYGLDGKVYLFGGNDVPHLGIDVFDPGTETVSSLGSILPSNLNAEGAVTWTDSSGKIVILCPCYGAVYTFNPLDNSFAPASFSLPAASAGFALDYAAYDSATGSIYLIEAKSWDGTDQSDAHIWIGTPVASNSPISIAENQAAGTVGGTFTTIDPDVGDTHTYSLVSGAGDNDNASFTIDGDHLKTAAVFDYETKSSYTIRIRSTDQGGLWIEKQFTIRVTDVNEAPTDIAVSNSTVAENQPAGTVVGTLFGTDPDAGQSATLVFSLIDGFGDNGLFSIDPATKQLKTAASFDYEAQNSYSTKIRATDCGSPALSHDEEFTISVTDVSMPWIIGPTAGTAANLTLIRVGNIAHLYETGTTNDIVPPMSIEDVTNIVILGPDSQDNALTIDFSGGNPIPVGGVSYDGGAGGHDTLALAGGSFARITFSFTGPGSGTIGLDGSTITYSGLEPISMTTAVVNLVLNYSSASETIWAEYAGPGQTSVYSTAAEGVTFVNPTGSLTINAGGGDDTIDLYGLGDGFAADLTVSGNSGQDSINADGFIDSGGGDVTLTASNGVAINGYLVTGGGNLVADADSDRNGTGTFTIAGMQPEEEQMGGSVAVDGGTITITAADMDLGGPISGSGALAFIPSLAGTSIGIGGGNGTFNLDDTEIGWLAHGFSSITIGDVASGTGMVDIDTATFLDPVMIAGGILYDHAGLDLIAPAVTLDGNVSPGQCPGALSVVGSFAFADGSIFTAEIGGTTAGIAYDQLQVTGSVTIGNNVTLSTVPWGGYVPVGVTSFTIIDNDGADAVTGQFAGLAEGAVISNFLGSGLNARITYRGGDGNDVVVMVIANNLPPTVALANPVTSLPENTSTSTRIKVADIRVIDDGVGTNHLWLSGSDAGLFEIDGLVLYLKAGSTLDYETNPRLDVTVAVDDPTVGGAPDGLANLSITVTDVNEAPSVTLIHKLTTLAENTDTSGWIKVADIVVSDDGLGSNTLSLSGSDAGMFEIWGSSLYLKPKVKLDSKTHPSLNVVVAVDDAAVGATPDGTAALSIRVIAPGNVGIAEQFTGQTEDAFDLSYKAIVFAPSADGSSYTRCVRTITELPTSTRGSRILKLQDDSFAEVDLTGGRTIRLFGVAYKRLYVGSNGYVTFTAGDVSFAESWADHFNLPRISALFDDLDPQAGGTVRFQQLSNRVVLTWQAVPQWGEAGTDSFQIEMYYDGRIQIAWMAVASQDAIVGLSAGKGIPVDFAETDLSISPSTPSLSIADVCVTEGNSGQQMCRLTVALSEPSSQEVTVRCSTSDCTATAGSDYLATDKIVHIAAGQMQASFDVPILGDTVFEADETFVVSLSNAVGAVIGQGRAAGCIRNDDSAKAVPFEQFTGGSDSFDLSHKAVALTPDSAGTSYSSSVHSIQVLPVNPRAGTVLSLGNDDSVRVDLTRGQTVQFFGVSYDHLYVSSNGSITFDQPGAGTKDLLAEHLATLGISGLSTDLNPEAGGTVRYQQLSDRVVVSWVDVPLSGHATGNTFQIEIFNDGWIQIAWLDVASQEAIVGLSDGQGVWAGTQEADLSKSSSRLDAQDLSHQAILHTVEAADTAGIKATPAE
jgi:hypothetical protein